MLVVIIAIFTAASIDTLSCYDCINNYNEYNNSNNGNDKGFFDLLIKRIIQKAYAP